MVLLCKAWGSTWEPLLCSLAQCDGSLSACQNKNSEFCAPLTSFDWNETDPKRLGTSSIDTTCTIWDIEVRPGCLCGLPPCWVLCSDTRGGAHWRSFVTDHQPLVARVAGQPESGHWPTALLFSHALQK